jgi:lipoic acid synthetase
MNLKHVVITSVNRDERKDGGAPIFAACINRIREVQPGCSIEVLIPDFKGSRDALKMVMDARPEILNHNVETVRRLFRAIQPQDRYEWAQATLTNAKELEPDVLTKSGIMVGLGETWDEAAGNVMQDLAKLGRGYFDHRPIFAAATNQHHPVERYYTPEEFAQLKQLGLAMGFKWVESGPLVRSSYHADKQVEALSKMIHKQP